MHPLLLRLHSGLRQETLMFGLQAVIPGHELGVDQPLPTEGKQNTKGIMASHSNTMEQARLTLWTLDTQSKFNISLSRFKQPTILGLSDTLELRVAAI